MRHVYRRLARGGLLATVAVGFGLMASAAYAAPPAAVDDALSARPTGALDVLANDSDPDGAGDQLSAALATAPAHGTATCSATGACFYRAAAGYVGSDAFTYTATGANGDTKTATVHVTVDAPSAAQPAIATDDDVATVAPSSVAFDVLANDRGTGTLSVQSSQAANHGIAACAPSGACTYAPAAGFSGRDGFEYVLRDAAGEVDTAAVHIAVAPAGSTLALTASGSPDAPEPGGLVGPGGHASWSAAVTPRPAGLASDELRALPRPAITSSLSGPHALVAGSTTLAAGFGPGGTAGAGALIGGAVSRTFPRPMPPISQGTGGDGHVPILVGSEVFAFFHHQTPTDVSCIDRATGTVCPGYPKQLNVGSMDINGPAVVHGSKIWWHALLGNGSFPQSASIGLYCWDAAIDSSCGMAIADRVPATIEVAASHPVLAAGKMWFATHSRLYCREPSTGAPCATPSLPLGLSPGSICTWTPYRIPCVDIVTHGPRVFVSVSDSEVACMDVVAQAPCSGWSSPKSFGGEWNLVNRHDAGGAAIGVCVVPLSGGTGQCVDDATPATTSTIGNWPAGFGPYHAQQEAETGTRTLVASHGRSGLGCYDWKTEAPCSGGGYDAGGWLDRDIGGAALPMGYGATFDGTCVIALGDPGEVYTIDPEGTAPCTSLSRGADTGTIDLRDQRCDATVGAARWKAVTLTDSGAAELDRLIVTVRDAQTHAVLLTGDLIPGATLDISSIDPGLHPSIVADASIAPKSGAHPWNDGVPPRIVVSWSPDPRQLCIKTKAADECSAAGTSSIGFAAHLATPAQDASAELSLRRRPCPAAPSGGGGSQPQHGGAPPAGPSPPVKPAAPACSGLRKFNIHVFYRGPIRRLRVTANGKRQTVLSMRPPVARIDLTKRTKQTVVVRIRLETKRGSVLRGTRTYHPCHEVGLPGHTWFYL